LVEIREVTTSRQLADFCKFPLTMYKDNEYFVPDLISDEINIFTPKKNPAFEFCDAKCFLAYRGNRIVGRIAGIISHAANQKWNTKRVRFSRIDFHEDIEIARALIKAVEDWGTTMGMDEIQGPIGFCDMDQEGMLVEGFDQKSMFITIYNYPYYPKFLEQMGFEKEADWVEFRIKAPDKPDERAARLSKAVLERYGLTLYSPKSRKEIGPLVRPALEVINRTYDILYGTVKLSDALLEKYYKQFKILINPEYLKVLMDKKGMIIGFGLAMPSLSNASKKSNGKLFPFGWYRMLRAPFAKSEVLDLYLVGVIPEMQNTGLPAVLIDAIARVAIKNSVKYAETGPELKINSKVQAMWKAYEVEQHKRRRCFIKKIEKEA
jgi:hypothetical protein